MQEKLLQNWEKKSGERQKEYKKFLHRANKNKVLKQLPVLNEEAFAKIDCLQCANCCKNYSPRVTPPDIKRISKYLGMKEGDFKEKYLVVDEDGDNVMKTKPCPLLAEDNSCTVYDVRPSDCARFPYMDDDFMLKRQPMALKNSTFCPITYYVIEKLIDVEKGRQV
jgi:Fe-S-cluster containining protein